MTSRSPRATDCSARAAVSTTFGSLANTPRTHCSSSLFSTIRLEIMRDVAPAIVGSLATSRPFHFGSASSCQPLGAWAEVILSLLYSMPTPKWTNAW